jgi:zinc transport system ATP-binding protein
MKSIKRNKNGEKWIASMSGVTFRYQDEPGTLPVLEDISLSIPPKDFLGLIGPNGGGKTTLLKVLLGILKPQTGSVSVLGRSPRDVSRRIGYVPQQGKVDVNVPATVLDVVLTGRLGLSSWGYGYSGHHISAAETAMDRVGVIDFRNQPIASLSGGQCQRVLIARALAAEAEILFLDEPMAGIDTQMEQGILELLHELNDKLPIVLVSHDLGFISTHVKRVACLNRRLVVHHPDEISKSLIAEMYQGHGPVHPIHHDPTCPIDGDGKDHTEEER